MKRLIIYSVLLLAVLANSCQKALDPVLGDPDERLSAALKSYKEQLVSAEYGWNGYLFTGLGGGYSFHFVFHEDGRVDMVGDLSEETLSEADQSTWRLKSSQQSLLIFDTYSYLHLLSDPDRNVFGGQAGVGYGSDYEFAFLESTGDTLRLRGKLNDIDFFMVKASQQDLADWQSGQVLEVAGQLRQFPFAATATGDLRLMLNAERKTVLLGGAESESYVSIPYTYNNAGVSLKTPYRRGNYAFSEIEWDSENKTYFVRSDGQRQELAVSAAPLFPLAPMLGYGKEFATIEFDGARLDPLLSPGLNDRWARAKENNLLYMGPPTGRVLLDYAVLRFLANSEVSIHFRYKHPVDGTLFTVGIWYRVHLQPDHTIQFTYLRRDNNTMFNDERIMKPFTADFFESKTFRADWVPDPEGGSGPLVAGLYVVGDANDFFYGIPR